MKTLLAALALSAACLSNAQADPLGHLIQFRTAEAGETCTRRDNVGFCTVGKYFDKSTNIVAVFVANPSFGKAMIGNFALAKSYCTEVANKADQTLSVSNFITHQGEVLLNCALRVTK
jgi:hypothetical protein